MPSYARLRDLVSHRIEIEYDSGARIVGYLAECRPPQGEVLLLHLSKAELRDGKGQLLERHDRLSVVPNVVAGIRVAEGAAGRER